MGTCVYCYWAHVSTATGHMCLLLLGTCVYCYWAGVGTVHGSFIACIYCISFFGGSDIDPNESLPRSSQAVRTDGGHEWRLASRKLPSLCCCCSDWKLKNLEFRTK